MPHKTEHTRKQYHSEYYQLNKDSIKARVYAQRTTREGKQKRADYAKRYMADPEVKAHRSLYNAAYTARPEVVERLRRVNLRSYGISLEEYNTQLERQNGLCALCARPAEQFPKSLFVDHNHETGAIRGLLCAHCNFAEGNIRQTGVDPIEFAQRLITYLGCK